MLLVIILLQSLGLETSRTKREAGEPTCCEDVEGMCDILRYGTITAEKVWQYCE